LKHLGKIVNGLSWRVRLVAKPLLKPFLSLLESPVAEDFVYKRANASLRRWVAAKPLLQDSTKPEVTIVVPIYNVEKYLDVAIQSALAQSHPNIQVVLVDDGSTDSSLQIAKKYDDSFSNVRLIHQENAGLSAARNTGAAAIEETDYLLFLDSDDVLPRNAVKNYLKAIGDLNVAVGKPTRLKGLALHKRHRNLYGRRISRATLLEEPRFLSDVTAWNKLMKFSFWKAGKYQFPEGFLYEDMALMTKIYAESGGFAVVSKTSYFWRVRVGGGSSITQERWNTKNLTHRLKAILDTLEVLNEKFPENSADRELRDYYRWSTARFDINFYLPWVEHTDQAFFKELQTSGERLFGTADASFWKKVPDRYRVALKALVANDRDGVIAAIRKSGLQVPAPTS
jgi:CDP-glycerol glycerophosphotransferase